VRNGSLVVAPPRDAAELTRFAERTELRMARRGGIARSSPISAGRFRRRLFFRYEGHLDPRRALPALADC
jgi:glycine oxidase